MASRWPKDGSSKSDVINFVYSIYLSQLVQLVRLVKSMQKSLEKLGATQVKVINMQLGNKISRVVAWTFLTPAQIKDFETT